MISSHATIKEKLIREWQYFLTGVMFYTRVNFSIEVPYSELHLNQSRKYFPLIGLILGAFAALVLLMAAEILPISIAVIISMAMTVLLTGAIHEDGFADCCDGFGGGWDKQQIITIMKDSRLGAYGALGLVFLLLLKTMALIELAMQSIVLCVVALITAHTLSRLMASWLIQSIDYVKDNPGSKSKAITSQRLSPQEFTLSSLPVFVAGGYLMFLSPVFVFAFPFVFAVKQLGQCYFMRRLGGYTGDCLGAIQQVTELCFLLLVLILCRFM